MTPPVFSEADGTRTRNHRIDSPPPDQCKQRSENDLDESDVGTCTTACTRDREFEELSTGLEFFKPGRAKCDRHSGEIGEGGLTMKDPSSAGLVSGQGTSSVSQSSQRLVGYARVSTDDQDLSLQIDALTKQGIAKTSIFMDKMSGAKTDRPGLAKCLASLRSGDVLVVWRLDRLGRSMRHLITVVEDLRAKGIGFRSLSEGAVDTTSASGELIFNIFSALAQFERRLIQERTRAGLAAARARGRKGGRPKITAADTKVVLAKKLYRDKSVEIDDTCKTLGISRATLYRYVALGEPGLPTEGQE